VASTISLLQGTLDLLILHTLSQQVEHGLGIARRIQQVTRGTFDVKPGSLFPALYRLEQHGWVRAAWGESENRRKAKFYTLTAAGRRRLRVEAEQWQRVSLAIDRALAVRDGGSGEAPRASRRPAGKTRRPRSPGRM
jgi:PadR family transcriptional regulator, regulatory protein PadR